MLVIYARLSRRKRHTRYRPEYRRGQGGEYLPLTYRFMKERSKLRSDCRKKRPSFLLVFYISGTHSTVPGLEWVSEIGQASQTDGTDWRTSLNVEESGLSFYDSQNNSQRSKFSTCGHWSSWKRLVYRGQEPIRGRPFVQYLCDNIPLWCGRVASLLRRRRTTMYDDEVSCRIPKASFYQIHFVLMENHKPSTRVTARIDLVYAEHRKGLGVDVASHNLQ